MSKSILRVQVDYPFSCVEVLPLVGSQLIDITIVRSGTKAVFTWLCDLEERQCRRYVIALKTNRGAHDAVPDDFSFVQVVQDYYGETFFFIGPERKIE